MRQKRLIMGTGLNIEKQCVEDGIASDHDGSRPPNLHIVESPTRPVPRYRNSLLAAVAYLDLTNALDFPANVWNQVPIPRFAKVLMGIGGSISILSTGFAAWDMVLAIQNVTFLRRERAHLRRIGKRTLVEQAWLSINYRELGWEIIDRMLLDGIMAMGGILVGTGCLLAIRGDVPSIFRASNIMSGYLGNSFVALYAVINTAWCVFMWRQAHLSDAAVLRAKHEMDTRLFLRMRKHSRRHKIYAVVNGLSILLAGIGSEISSTLWPGYVVLIPCVFGSIFCNYFWRYCLGYDRLFHQQRHDPINMNIRERLQKLNAIRLALAHCQAFKLDFGQCIAEFHKSTTPETYHLMQDLGLHLTISSCASSSETVTKQEMHHASYTEQVRTGSNADILYPRLRALEYEKRFLLELYGYYLIAQQQHVIAEEC